MTAEWRKNSSKLVFLQLLDIQINTTHRLSSSQTTLLHSDHKYHSSNNEVRTDKGLPIIGKLT